MPEARVAAVLALLGDRDPQVQRELLAHLEQDQTLLAATWEAACRSGDPNDELARLVLRQDAEGLADAYAAAVDLEAGCWLLPRLAIPRLDHGAVARVRLDALAERLRTMGCADAGEVAERLARDFGFAGDRSDYDHPLNSLLPWVLERRCGLPIALAALWLLLCRRLGLRAEAVAMPGHVVGRWEGGYLDLFSGFRRLERADLDRLARKAGAADATPWLGAASDRALLRRMARNLTLAWLRRGDLVRSTVAHALATS